MGKKAGSVGVQVVESRWGNQGLRPNIGHVPFFVWLGKTAALDL